MGKVLFGKRTARLKWLVALPGLVALLFLGLALEDDGLAGAAPYMAILVMSALYVVRPMFVVWAPVFAAFVFYAGAVLLNPENGPRNEWIFFSLLGAIPAVQLWIARPRDFAKSSAP